MAERAAAQKTEEKKEESGADLHDGPPRADGAEPPQKIRKRSPEAATWGGRWIPSDGPQKDRMMVIKSVFEEQLMHRLKGQSFFQSPFFKLCNAEFKARGLNNQSPYDDFVACARAQVDKFLSEPSVRVLAKLCAFMGPLSCFPTAVKYREPSRIEQ